jgi:hypothetical protein
MRFEWRRKIRIALVVLCLQIGLVQFTQAQEPAPQAGRGAVPAAKRGGFMQIPVDPRVQMRSCAFKDGDISHGPVIEQGLPSVYAFFAKHSKQATH